MFRKSTSLDNINLPVEPVKPGWKSYSLQRGAMPPTSEAEGYTLETEEDIYGRCTNMRLTSFSEVTQVSIQFGLT